MRRKSYGEKGRRETESEEQIAVWDRNFDPLEEARDLLAAREHEKKMRLKRGPAARAVS